MGDMWTASAHLIGSPGQVIVIEYKVEIIAKNPKKKSRQFSYNGTVNSLSSLLGRINSKGKLLDWSFPTGWPKLSSTNIHGPRRRCWVCTVQNNQDKMLLRICIPVVNLHCNLCYTILQYFIDYAFSKLKAKRKNERDNFYMYSIYNTSTKLLLHLLCDVKARTVMNCFV